MADLYELCNFSALYPVELNQAYERATERHQVVVDALYAPSCQLKARQGALRIFV